MTRNRNDFEDDKFVLVGGEVGIKVTRVIIPFPVTPNSNSDDLEKGKFDNDWRIRLML